MTVNVHKTKAQFLKLLAKAGKPFARLFAVEKKSQRRMPGIDKGKVWMAPDFDAPLPDEILNRF